MTHDRAAGPYTINVGEPLDAHAEYARRRAARVATVERLTARERAISAARLVVFVAGLVIAWLAIDVGRLSGWWIGVPVALFVALVLIHDQVIRTRQRAERAAAFYAKGLARLEDRWAGSGTGGERFLDPQHPYALDLDLFGRGSLFELLCTARTAAGEEVLADWLCRPATLDGVRDRHAAVIELRPRLDLREDLALLGSDVRAGLHPDALAAWGTAPSTLGWPLARVAAPVLIVLSIVAAAGWALTGIGPLPFVVSLAIEGVFGWSVRARVQRVIRAVDSPGRDLALFAQLLARLEAEFFTAPLLVTLRAALDTNGIAPSQRIAHLHRLIHLLEARRNELFAPLAAMLLWTTQLAFAIEAWRAISGPAIARWLRVVGEIEALCAVAGYAYERPHDPFPELCEGGPSFSADGLGHPLLPEGRCVRNDLRLGGPLRLLIVSGSNMSGKSTLLRTVGTNVVLALAGAPVRAQRLTLSMLAVGSSVRVQDSLQDGTSRFYAEITRLRHLVDQAGKLPPLLFLLDELLHGTNSHDRRIGAEAVVRGLVDRNAIGLVTTHDLALADIVGQLGPRAANVHFEDQLEGGRMRFDYRLRPGVVTRSNALELMRAVGLEV